MEYIFNVKTNTKLFMELIKSLPNDIAFNFNEYGNDCIGYNDISGCVWIALENDIVASNDGRNINFIKRNFATEEEIVFDSYEEALLHNYETDDDDDADANNDADDLNCIMCNIVLERDKDGLLLCVGEYKNNNSEYFCKTCFNKK